MNKTLRITAWATITLALVSMGVFFFWVLYPYKIIEFKDSVYPVLNEGHVVKQGENLIYLVRYCKYKDQSFTITRSFVDGVIYTSPQITSNKPEGCHDNLVYVEVPKAIPTGKLTLEILYQGKVNPVRTIDIIKKTEPFTVIGK